MTTGGMPELGSKISLISKADIRYEGRLYTVDPNECTIALSSVRSFGTEDRETQFQIAPQSQIYDYILFRGSDIKDIRVVNNGMPHPNDPAIMQVQLPNGQLMPHFPMQAMNTPMANYGNPFGAMGGIGGMGSSSATATGLAPGSFMLNKPKQPSELNDAIPQEFSLNAINNSSTAAPPNAPSTSAAEHKDQDLLAGASRSTTPISLISRKSPSADMAVQVNQQQQHPQQQHQQHPQQQQHNNNAGNRDAGHKRQNHQQRGGSNNNTGNGSGAGSVGGGGIGGGGGGGGNGGGYFQRDRRDSGRLDSNQHNNYNNHENRNHYNNQRNNQNQNNRGWTMNRGQSNNNNNNNNNMRNRGRGRVPNQGYRQMSGNPSKNNRPKNTIKFEQDFDFEQANNKFEELRSQLSKLKVGDEPKTEQCSSPTSQINGETDKKDDSGNETGAGEHEPEDEEITVGYDKTKSFFDNISCEAAQDRTKNKKNDWRQERKLNSETFGVSSTRRGSYRGRGNYYNRNMNNYGGYNRGYRGGNFNNRNRNNNNNRMGQQNSQNLPQKNQNMQQPQSQPQTQKPQENNTQPQVTAVAAGQ